MDAADRRHLGDLERRVRRLQDQASRQPVRRSVGGSAAGLQITTVDVLPAIPTVGVRLVLLTHDDCVYWASQYDTHWHPLGGKFGLTTGEPGEPS